MYVQIVKLNQKIILIFFQFYDIELVIIREFKIYVFKFIEQYRKGVEKEYLDGF